jgi:predicted DCC family thiol-disulfide oxidoreductase YuxK
MTVESFPDRIVFFDGVCGLCNKTVDFLIRTDHEKKLRYAPLQGYTAKRLLTKIQIENLDSVVYYRDGKYLVSSTAVLRLLLDVGGLWKILSIFLILPAFVRNAVYFFIAKRRYNWFGKSDACRIPTPEERHLFLD